MLLSVSTAVAASIRSAKPFTEGQTRVQSSLNVWARHLLPAGASYFVGRAQGCTRPAPAFAMRDGGPAPRHAALTAIQAQPKAAPGWGRRLSGRSKKVQGPVTWQSVGLLVCVGGGVVAYFNSTEKERLQRVQGER